LRLVGIAVLALEFVAEAGGAAFGGEDPGAESPGRVMADMLGVPAREVGNPVGLLVLVKGDDFARDGHPGNFITRTRPEQGPAGARVKHSGWSHRL